MLKTFLFLLSSSILPSFLHSGVAGQCNGCSHLISYWLASEMVDLERSVCKSSIVSNEVVKSSIILLLDQSRAMMGDGRLNVRGRRGNVGATGGTGFVGGTGPYGVVGATGPMGQTGAPGPPGPFGVRGKTGSKGVSGNIRAKRHALSSRGVHKAKKLFKRQTSTPIFDKISPFLSDCPTYRNYFTSFANQLDNLTSWNGFTSTDELNRLINKYREVQDLYRNVSHTFESLKNIVQSDPRYIGATGATGFHGRTGINGNSGFTGYTGSIGNTGDSGFYGVLGMIGTTGDTGATGATGAARPG